MRSTFSIFIILLLQLHLVVAQSIDGPIITCGLDCYTYEVSSGAGGPYIWTVSDGVASNGMGTSINICWDDEGPGMISVIDNSANPGSNQYLLTVDIIEPLDPEIFFPLYPTCVSTDTLNSTGQIELPPITCKTACPGSVATYFTEDISGVTNSWLVEGGSILSTSSNSATIAWDDALDYGFIALYQEQGSLCSDSIKYCIEMLESVDLDILSSNGGATSATLCVGQTLYLEALSTNAIEYDWTTTGGQTFSGSEVAITFPTAGNHQVALTGITDCYCADTIYYDVIVGSVPGPEILCTGISCVGEEHTYYAGETCSTYSWSISSEGTIVEGGGAGDDYITVIWNNGPSGVVSLSTSGCDTPTCQEATEVSIPVMDGNAYISGPDVVCWDEVSKFTAPYYQGADYIWSISGNGTIISGYNTNEITVEWQTQNWQPDSSFIELYIDNCYLECTAYGNKEIDLKRRFLISGDSEICENNNSFFSAAAGYDFAKADWEVYDPQGVLIASIPDEDFLNYTFVNGPGTYQIIAYENSGTYCNNEATAFIRVISTPDAPSSIDGPSAICINEYYNYSVDNDRTNYSARWNIRDGNIFQVLTGNTISYQWTTSGPYTLEVLFVDDLTGCRSDLVTLLINQITPSALVGDNMVCIDNIGYYEVIGAEGNTLDWSITPANAGSIIELPDGKAEILWNIGGIHQIETLYCGNILNFSVEVEEPSIPSLVYPSGICEGSIATLIAGLLPGETLVVRNDDDDIIGTGSSLNIMSGYYTIEFTNLDGCLIRENIFIDSYPAPEILISTPGPTAYCDQLPSLDLYAINTNEGYTYQWFRNNIPVGTDSELFTTNQVGTYTVEVTDKNGCTAISNEIVLETGVCIGFPADCVATGTIDFIPSQGTFCNTYDFANNSVGYVPGSLAYNFGDPDSGVNNTSSNENPKHVYAKAGFYFVILSGGLPADPPPGVCLGGVGKLVTVPVAADFDFTPSCTNALTSFRELATFLPTFSISSYEWDFGDPGSGLDNMSSDQNPEHSYNTSGKYIVTLTVTSNTGCQARIAKEITVNPTPVIDFDLPSIQCISKGLQFVTLDTGNIVKLEWDFGDPGSGAANNSNSAIAIHEYDIAGAYFVTLTVENIYGCINIVSKILQISDTNLSGQITPDVLLPVCLGETVTLSAPPGGVSFLWSTGENTPTIEVTEPGSYGVTVTGADVCDYVPDEFLINFTPIPETTIRGFIVNNFSASQETYYDEIEICLGENIVLQANFISNTSYLWSNSETGSFLNQENFSTLPVGEYEYTVELTDNLTGCTFLSDPFKVIIRPLPDVPQIQVSETDPCEGTPVTFTVTNPQPGAYYTWNNGKTGLSITESAAGAYFVSVISPFGCSAESFYSSISSKPNGDVLVLGCRQACFPDTLCLPNLGGITYQWIKDGIDVPAPEGTIRDYIVTEPGDYQVILTNWLGCVDTSDVLNLEPEPADQSVEGKIFIDNNGDGIYDIGDELLSGIPVYLYSATTIVANTSSDVNGTYIFDPIIDTDLSVQIDTAGLGLMLVGSNLVLPLDFSSCIEDKELDFPLYRDCVPTFGSVTVAGCAGQMIDYEGTMITVGETVDIPFLNAEGCDSTLQVITTSFLPPLLVLNTSSTCIGVDNGGLDITINSGTNLSFAIDGATIYTADLQYNSLSSGPHVLTVLDDNGCYTDYNFMIDENVSIPAILNTSASCAGSDSGSVEVITSGAAVLSYSIDGVNFSSNNIFTDLPTGDYDIQIMDIDGCISVYNTSIIEAVEPDILLSASGTCDSGSGGTISIQNLSTENLAYSMDGSNFVVDNVFTGLSVGVYDVFYLSADNCVFVSSIAVPEDPMPSITLGTDSSCPDSPTGSIMIDNNSSEILTYSLDGLNYQSEIVFDNLAAGNYTISVLTPDGCVFTFDTEIEEGPSLEVEINDPIIDCSIDAVTLSPIVIEHNGIINYSWSNGSNSEEIIINDSDTYVVEISDQCTTQTYQWEVDFVAVDETVRVYRPNIFSPNNDGQNDCFELFPDPALEILSYELYIFDRWGNKVFESSNPDNCWQGRFQNEEAETGVYTWLLLFDTSFCNERKSVKQAGDITLIR
jgi:gliding motility-associated-like protein